ncbi:MAG: NUDIX hydrolase [Galactobacter sp.]
MSTQPWANLAERRAATPPLAVSTVVFTLRIPADASGKAVAGGKPTLHLPLVRRERSPYRDQWALPGGPLRGDTSLRASAATALRITTGLAPTLLEQLYTFGGTDRGEGPRVVSVVYWALVREQAADAVLVEDPNVAWFPVDHPAVAKDLAFDHSAIVAYAVARLRAKVGWADVARRLLGETFTLAQLREVHEAILGRSLDQANFRRTMLARGGLEDTGHVLTGGRNRPPKLYRAVETSAETTQQQRDQELVPDPEGETA